MDWLIGHLVGDYIFQRDWMALNKKKPGWAGWIPCVAHCLTYTLAVYLFVGARWPAVAYLAVFLAHFLQDRTDIIHHWMTINGQTRFRDGVCGPWSAIVVDNVWHLWVLFMVDRSTIGGWIALAAQRL